MAVDWKGILFALVPLLAGAGLTKNAVDAIAGTATANGAAASWPMVTGRVTTARIEEGTTAGNRGQTRALYTLRVSYAFQVAGSLYRSDRLSFAQPHQHAARSDAQDELSAYPVGGPVTVHYDPARPANAVLLIEGIGSIVYLLLGFGLLLALLGLWGLWMVLRPKRRAPAGGPHIPDAPPVRAIEPAPPFPVADAYATPADLRPIEVRPSACGTLHVEIYEGVWKGNAARPDGQCGRWSRLIDRSSGAVLIDTSAIFDTSWSLPEDGSLLLRVTWDARDVHREDLYRIDPASRSYRELSFGGPDRALTELWAEVHVEHQHARVNDIDRPGGRLASGVNRLSRWFSPLGTVRCELVEWEIVHSWGFIPRVFLVDGNQKVLDLGDWGDPATFTIEGENLVRIALSNPGNEALIVHPHDRLGRRAEETALRPLTEIEAELRR